jgi:hypothetical protein
MKKLLPILLILTACNNADDKTVEPQPDSTSSPVIIEKVDTVLTSESFKFFTKPEKQNSMGSYKMVSTWKEDSMIISEFNTNSNFLNKYRELLRFSPDSLYYIDMGSYNVEVVTDANGKKTYQDLGPDTEISLVSLNENKKRRLLFLGPGSIVEDAGWMDNETLLIAGKQLRPDGNSAYNVIWKYHLPTHTFFMYEQQ